MQGLPRKLGPIDAASVVIGVMIGSGIFLTPNVIAQQLPSAWSMMAVWIAAGVLSLVGALAYAELGAMMPDTGGQYVYLREAYGPLCAFLCGWAFLAVVQTGSTATLAAAFSIYLAQFVPLEAWQARLASLGLIAALAAINYRGVIAGARVQNLFTFLKLAGLLVLIGAAFLASPRPAAAPSGPGGFELTRFGVAMIACLWTYKGWQTLSFVVGEIREPARTVPRSLVLGVGAVMAIYLLANLAYLRMLPPAEIAETPRVAAAAAGRAIGSGGAAFVTLTILISIIGAANGGIMATPRLMFAQAADGLLPRGLAAVHPRFQTPHVAFVAMGLVSTALLL
ncbi:MAG: APC family permease, partial [Bryobacteraceae bacterium]